ncbi:hypothetical protein VD0002_g1791 [Verticillium dahliae]|uniref:Mediator of RNA polymerase II transcription subunit 17 n=2 Tax=Verticillium dahliae TaxID=27337 RepID=G2WWA2_VERDV|nr:mediator of RNA polymerase II transcription subunit 17 [Verticillium dahliae VdLs.17]KAF3350144.1 UV excision repair protein rhp23 [Verticillium dahliae VDG2]KAH6706191.1 mediator of RNA polymerase II transcription subunit 17 [Verticillium dahliae]EGY19872.1 mediator of RNA polymerase II transcription subunit 17 [Verticillium dahliae VdLs.17]PNH28794.1 hypothetical protein BJF96_g7860 [Verticillium dahliae]PNH55995.1 hypothetical protein VD0003_g1654 [Verticillium dahliae]
MANNPTQSPYTSLRPPPIGSRKPKNLGEFIGRIQAERGFRNVTEASLREEVAAKTNGEAKEDDVQMSVTDDEDDEEAKDIHTVKGEIMRNIDAAHNTAMVALDFVSLLLTKHNPNQAGVTLSQALRDFAGIGTLGVSKFKDSEQAGDKRRREEKRQEAKEVSQGWTLMEIERTRKAAEKSAAMLAKEVDREEKYWSEILAVKQNGWSMCRLPAERHTLGVRFGFTEASSEFRNNSLAPLRRGDDGSVVLEQGRAGVGCQRISVTLARDGEISGQTATNSSILESAPLQERVLEARNTIFSQELWHELHREAHSLASYGVRASDSSITYEPKTGPSINISLDTLLGVAPTVQEKKPDNWYAEMTQLSLHVLLSFAHRENEVQRRRPGPPHQRRHEQHNQYHLIRPILSRAIHDVSVRQCTRLVGDLVRILRQAGMEEAAFTLNNPQFVLPNSDALTSTSSNRPTAAQALVNLLLAPSDFQLDVTLTPRARIQIRGRTWFLPLTTTQYQVHLLPPLNSTDATQNSLLTSCPPYRERDGYPDLQSLKVYLLTAIPRALADLYLPLAESLSSNPSQATSEPAEEASNPIWVKSVRGNAIQDSTRDAHEVAFELDEKSNADGSERLTLKASGIWYEGSEARTKFEHFDGVPGGEGQASPTKTMIKDIIEAVVTATEAV